MESSKQGSKKMPKKRRSLRINMPVSRWSIRSLVFLLAWRFTTPYALFFIARCLLFLKFFFFLSLLRVCAHTWRVEPPWLTAVSAAWPESVSTTISVSYCRTLSLNIFCANFLFHFMQHTHPRMQKKKKKHKQKTEGELLHLDVIIFNVFSTRQLSLSNYSIIAGRSVLLNIPSLSGKNHKYLTLKKWRTGVGWRSVVI